MTFRLQNRQQWTAFISSYQQRATRDNTHAPATQTPDDVTRVRVQVLLHNGTTYYINP